MKSDGILPVLTHVQKILYTIFEEFRIEEPSDPYQMTLLVKPLLFFYLFCLFGTLYAQNGKGSVDLKKLTASMHEAVQQGDEKNAQRLGDSLKVLFTNTNDTSLVKHGFELASMFGDIHDYKGAVTIYEHLIKITHAAKDSTNGAKAHYYIGASYRNLGVLNRALEHFFLGLSIAEATDDLSLSSLIYIQIGIIKKDQQAYEEAINYYNKSLSISKDLNNISLQASILNNLGSVYKGTGDYPKAKEYFLQAIEINKALGNTKNLSYNYNNLANIFEETNDLENARIYHEKSIELKEDVNDKPSLAVSYSNLALVYMKMNQYDKALEYVQKSLELAKRYQVAEILPDAYSQLATILASKGNFKAAFNVMERLNTYNDSLAVIDKKAIISEMEAKYARQKIESENELLKKDILLSEAELQRKDAFLFALVICIAMLIIVVMMYYLSYRSRTEANKTLKAQNIAIKEQKERIEHQKEKIEEANLFLERARKDKEVFFSTISHDMKGPLNAISAILTLLNDYELEDEVREQVMIMDYSAKALTSLIEDIMDFSNLETGRLRIEQRPVKLVQMVEEVCKSFQFISNEKQVDLIFEHGQDELHVMSDPKRIRQILFNLVGNAFKFTREGFVKISLITVERSPEISDVELVIQDTGIGIPEDKLDVIFNKFTQANEDTYKDFGGSGLGLYISKNLIERMGGRIQVESKTQEGTTFRVYLPLKKV